MKRIMLVLLVFVFCLTCVVSPVSASSFEVPKTYFNVLDYATPNDFASTAVSLPDSQGTISFDIPGEMVFSYVDILVSSTSDITSANIGNSQLNVYAISAGMYRLEGTIPYTSYNSISLGLFCSSASVVTFLSFLAYNREFTPKNIVGYIDCYHNGDSVVYKQQSSPSTTTSHRFTTTENTTDYCTIDCGSDNFHLYDYLAFRFRTNLEVRSIVGMTSDGKYPLSVTVSSFNDPLDRTYSYYYCILDVSGISWDDDLSPNKPILQVNCSKTGSQECIFNFYDCVGFVNVEYIDPELNFFRKFSANVEDWFSDLKTGIVDKLDDLRDKIHSYMTSNHNSLMKQLQRMTDYLMSLATGSSHSSDADSFNDSVSDQSQELEDMTSIMGSVEKPDINNIDFNPSTMVDTNTLVLATSGLSDVLGNQIIIRILLMALTFALVGFVLYGKK